MTQEMQFKALVAQYAGMNPEDVTDEMRFREDLHMSSLDFMTFLGDLEDTFDVEVSEKDLRQIVTVAEALELLERLQEEG